MNSGFEQGSGQITVPTRSRCSGLEGAKDRRVETDMPVTGEIELRGLERSSCDLAQGLERSINGDLSLPATDLRGETGPERSRERERRSSACRIEERGGETFSFRVIYILYFFIKT